MSSNSIGGFYVDLGLKVNQDSFGKGRHSVENLTNSISRFIGTVRNAVAIGGLAKLADSSSKFEAQQLRTASALGISVRNLDKLRIAAKLGSVDANSLIGGVSALDERITRLRAQAKPINEILGNVALLHAKAAETTDEFKNLSDNDLLNMDADERAYTILRMAQSLKDQKEAAVYISDILGSGGADLYRFLEQSKWTVTDLLSKTDTITLIDEASAGKAFGYVTQFNETAERLKSIGALFGSELGGSLTPILKELNSFLNENSGNIAKRITSISDSLGNITKAVAPIAGTSVKTAIGLVDDLAGSVSALLGADYEKAGENFKKFLGDLGIGVANILGVTDTKTYAEKSQKATDTLLDPNTSAFEKGAAFISSGLSTTGYTANTLAGGNEEYNSVKAFSDYVKQFMQKNLFGARVSQPLSKYPQDVQAQIIDVLNSNPLAESVIGPLVSDLYKHHYNKATGKYSVGRIQDGIVRPDGRVTHVAPDDWVFALRDITDLAAAFIPSEFAGMSSTQDITINQTININTPTDLLPQTIKQQAYTGAHDGMLQAMADGYRRIQMMPGLK